MRYNPIMAIKELWFPNKRCDERYFPPSSKHVKPDNISRTYMVNMSRPINYINYRYAGKPFQIKRLARRYKTSSPLQRYEYPIICTRSANDTGNIFYALVNGEWISMELSDDGTGYIVSDFGKLIYDKLIKTTPMWKNIYDAKDLYTRAFIDKWVKKFRTDTQIYREVYTIRITPPYKLHFMCDNIY